MSYFQYFRTAIAGAALTFSLDEYKDFQINNWIDECIYNIISTENEKWTWP